MAVDQLDFKEAMRAAADYLYDFEKQARRDFSFAALNQWSDQDVEKLKEEGRPALTFDRTRPILEALTGAEITNRYTARYLPREASLEDVDRYVSKAGSKVARWIQQTGDYEQQESAAFHDTMVCGVGCLEQLVEYDEDPDGLILNKRIPIWEVAWDPSSVEPNMADARWILRDRWIDIDEIASLFGQDAVDEVISAATNQMSGQGQGLWTSLMGMFKKTHDYRHAYDLRRGGERFYDPRNARIRLWEWQRMVRRYQTRIFAADVDNPEAVMQALSTGQPVPQMEVFIEGADATQKEMERISQLTTSINANLPEQGMLLDAPEALDDFPVRYYYRSYHTGSQVLKEESIPTECFTYEFITAYEDWSKIDRRYYFGIVRPMRDPQKYANFFLSSAAWQWASNPKGALLFEEGMFEDHGEAAKEWAKPTGFIGVRDGALQTPRDRFRHITSQASLRGIETLLAHALAAVPAAAGVSEAYMVGSSNNISRTSTTGIQSIQQQNLKNHANPFDSLRLYRKRLGRKLLKYTQEYMDPERIAKIVGPDELEFVDMLKNGDVAQEYQVVVEEVPTSANEKQEVFKLLLETNFLPQLVSQGVPIPPDMADFFPIPAEAAAQLKAALKQNYDLQMKNLTLQGMQMDMMMQQGVQPPAPGGEAPPGQEPQPEEAPTGVPM